MRLALQNTSSNGASILERKTTKNAATFTQTEFCKLGVKLPATQTAKCAVNRYCTLYKKENLKKSEKIFAKVRKLQNNIVPLQY